MQFTADQIREKGSTLTAAFVAILRREPTPWELQAILSQAWLETSMGEGWSGDCADSNNWGAIQTRDKSCCLHTDHKPDGTPYKVHLKCYETEFDGAADLIQEGYVKRRGTLEAAHAGDLGAVAGILWGTHYYGGICKPYPAGSDDCMRKVVRDYASSMHYYATKIAAAYGEPVIPMGTLPQEPGSGSSSGESSSAGNIVAFGLLGALGVGVLAMTMRKR